MKKHYLIFQRYAIGHSYADFAYAETPLEAIQRSLLHGCDQLSLENDGSLILDMGRTRIRYPHALAYIEAEYKTQGEWQMREIPQGVLEADYAEGFCGEDTGWIDEYFDACRPYLRRDFPRSRAKAFLWYLKKGALVTFYKRINPNEIQILRRYRYHWDGQNLTIDSWEGSYNELLEQLLIEMPEPRHAG
jgi:hypothetical protein